MILLTVITTVYYFTRKEVPPPLVKSVPVKDPDASLTKDSVVKGKPDSTAADSLFDLYYKRPPVPANYPVVLAASLTDYQNNRLESIEKLNIEQLPTLRGEDSKNEVTALAHFYKGIAALEKAKLENAIKHFQAIPVNTADLQLNEEGYWYQSLACLKMHDYTKAAASLQMLRKSAKYGLKSAQLLTLLNK